nr:reverse transcriptase domain-containing protein [Tanacetum cinerariifolium]
MSFEISFADALILMPKFASTLKALIGNKEKLSEMARTPLNEHCSVVFLKELPEKLGDPSKFLILYFDADLRVPLILRRSFLKTGRALIDVFEDKMSQDVITVGSTMRISLLYRGEYYQRRERFMNYLEEQTDGEAMINSIQNGDQPLPVIAQVSLAGNAQNAPPTLKDPNNEPAKDLWDALERQMRGSEYGEQERKAAILYEYETFKAIEGEQLLDTYLQWKQYGTLMRQTKNLMDVNIDALYNILKQNQSDVNDALGYKKKAIVVTSDPLALVAKKTNVSKRKEKVIVYLDFKGSDSDESSSSAEETIAEVAYYTFDSESESEYETSEYFDNSTNYGLFVNDNDDQEIFHDAIESASENFIKNHIDSQKDYDKSEVDHNDSEEKEHLVDKLIQKFNHKIAKYQKRIEKANQPSKDLESQNKDLQENMMF